MLKTREHYDLIAQFENGRAGRFEHSGILQVGDFSLRCYRLSNGMFSTQTT